MNRTGVIIVATLLSLVAAIGSLGGMSYLSWTRAQAVEEARLQRFAQQALQRAQIPFHDASVVLHRLHNTHAAPCSNAHILQMRKITINTRSIEDVGYFQKGVLKCTSWQRSRNPIIQTIPDFITADGIQISKSMLPEISGKPMVGMFYAGHKVLIDPARFTDIVLEPEIQIAITTSDGHALSTLHQPDMQLVGALLNGSQAKTGIDSFSVVVRDGELAAVVLEPYGKIRDRLWQEQLIWVPFGLLLALLFIGGVVWISCRRLSPLGELRFAIEQREFIVHYQPIIALQSGICTGAEALVRWRRPDGTIVRPDLFIPLAEESGLILPITDQVIELVIADLGAWLTQHPDLHIAINLSAQDIKTGRVLDVLQAKLENTGIANRQIWLEATERGFMDMQAARATIDKARAQGFWVAIDDFGTGYSSLSYLQKLPLDALKIDKSFIDTIGTDSVSSNVTPHIIDMAKTLQLNIVAEGIETQEQADYLLAREVEYGQGWLYSKALPAADFMQFCQTRAGAAATTTSG